MICSAKSFFYSWILNHGYVFSLGLQSTKAGLREAVLSFIAAFLVYNIVQLDIFFILEKSTKAVTFAMRYKGCYNPGCEEIKCFMIYFQCFSKDRY